jgi:general stress protein 26
MGCSGNGSSTPPPNSHPEVEGEDSKGSKLLQVELQWTQHDTNKCSCLRLYAPLVLERSPRTGLQRKTDVLAKLEACRADCWVASAAPSADAHLVPLTFAWDGERIVLATEQSSATARNITASKRARLALGGTRDVVMIDATLHEAVDLERASPDMADAYAQQAEWDPRAARGQYVFLLLRPERIQAWREVDEIAGRTIMRAGAWLV